MLNCEQRYGQRLAALIPALLVCAFSAILVSGCGTTDGKPDASRPARHYATIYAAKGWQPTGIRARKDDVIYCKAEGKWGYEHELYTADGDKDCIKTHNGVKAPSFALLMRLTGSTNYYYHIGSETNAVARETGNLFFRSNISLPVGIVGSVRVEFTVSHDADGDGVSDYEEINVWKTDPKRIDTDGDGFTDLEEADYKRQKQRKKEGRVPETH